MRFKFSNVGGVRPVKIGTQSVGPGYPVMVIAEIGINHEGDFAMAQELVHAAKWAGVDAVKFQIVFADTLYPPSKRNSEFHKLFREAELPFEDYVRLKELADSLGLLFLASYNDRAGVDILMRLDAPAFKIASTQLTNIPLISYTAAQRRPLILSTGMATLGEIDDAITTVRAEDNEEIILLHCVSSYPTQPEEVNLRAMNTLECTFGLPVGLSDHTTGQLAAISAVAREACLIEGHFTLDKTRSRFDHKLSSDPAELKEMVQSIRLVERMLGQSYKLPTPAESEARKDYRVSMAAARDIAKGERITAEMITGLRPGCGVSTMYWRRLIGKPAPRSLKAGEFFTWSDLA